MREDWPGQYQGRIWFCNGRTSFYEAARAFESKAEWLLQKAGPDPFESYESRAVYAQRAARWLRAAGRAYQLDLKLKGRL